MIGSMLRKAQLSGGCAATDPPGQVGGLTATGGVGTISLSWNADSTAAPNQATYYQIERSPEQFPGIWTFVTETTSTSFVDTRAASTTWYYRVSACNCDSCGLVSATAGATTQSSTPTASWTLDFSSGTPSGYTLTRASSGTYVDSSGYVASASTDVARLTHNSSGTRLGLLVEESRTNQALRSEDFGNAYWTKNKCSITANNATSPDNTTTADLIVEDSATGFRGLNMGGVTVAGGVVCGSCFCKKPSTNGRDVVGIGFESSSGYFGRRFDLTNGTSVGTTYNTNTTNVTNIDYGVEDYGNGWYRCWVSASLANNTGVNLRINPMPSSTTPFLFGLADYTGDGVSGILVWGAQQEAGAKPTAYIPTTTATVTRSADLAHVLDSAITSWGDPGALVVHFYPPGKAGTLLSTDDASTAQVGIEASSTTAARAFWSSGSTSTGTIGTGVQKAVHYWNGSVSKFVLNGGSVQSGTNNLTIANTDFVTLGAEATDSSGVPGTFSQYANCVIRKVEFYSGTLTDANLQTITT